MKQKTGYGLLVNTSFNVRGEPIVCTPEDAYRCFMRTEMDCLVIGNHLFKKKEQPSWEEKENWAEVYELDWGHFVAGELRKLVWKICDYQRPFVP